MVTERAARLVTVVAQAGVGKSRLIAEFARDAERTAGVLHGNCLPYGEGITFWPMAEVVRDASGISEEDPPETALRKIGGTVGDDGRVSERLASLTGLSARDFPVEELFWSARKLLETLAANRPVVVVFEDVHWAESTFLALIEHLVESAGAPILVGVGAPTSLAVSLAADRGLTLGGFARGGRLNVYTGAERVT